MSPQYQYQWISQYDVPVVRRIIEFGKRHWLSTNDSRNAQDIIVGAELICVAYLDKQIVGTCMVSVGDILEGDQLHWLTFCVVAPEHRGRGVFRQLYFRVIDQCLARGFVGLNSYSEERIFNRHLQNQGWEFVRDDQIDNFPVRVYRKLFYVTKK